MPVPSEPCAALLNVTSSMASRRGPTMAKNPSVVLLVLSWMFTPSSVMLMVLCGRPLTIESRAPARRLHTGQEGDEVGRVTARQRKIR